MSLTSHEFVPYSQQDPTYNKQDIAGMSATSMPSGGYGGKTDYAGSGGGMGSGLPSGTTPGSIVGAISSVVPGETYPGTASYGTGPFSRLPYLFQSLSGLGSWAYSLVAPLVNMIGGWLGTALDIFSVYWNAYPSLRAFVYVFTALAAIPVSLFLAYATISLAIVGGIALTGLAVVEGSILGFGLLFLTPVLFFSLVGSLLGVGLFTTLLYGLRATSVTLGTAQDVTGLQSGFVGGTLGITKNTAAMAADMASKAESMVVGRSGVPVPLTGRV
ncbi:hypothetical protein BC828DRAFT_410076 [Blastocladiella britannica]|nr:hypothetical protein BC828DRAFT_410076 [Blastocladiella britannica]